MTSTQIFPRLVVGDASDAIEFYIAALGAREQARFTEPSGVIVHAELVVGDSVFSLTEADGSLNVSPQELGGSPLLLTVVVADADETGRAMEAAGAEVVIPIDDRYYGRREGRLRDPFGHLWIVSQSLEGVAGP